MLTVVFKNIDKSEMIRELVAGKIATVTNRFPNLSNSKITVTLSMENSPRQVGPDLFTVKFQSRGGLYKSVIVQKSAANFYAALADLVDHLQERLNRFSDKTRIQHINRNRAMIVSKISAEAFSTPPSYQ